MKLRLLLSTLALSLALTPAVALADEAPIADAPIADGSICAVFDQQVTQVQLDQLIADSRTQFRDSDRPFPAAGSTGYRQLESQAVDFLVQTVLTNHAAAGFGITVSEGDVDKAFVSMLRDSFDGSRSTFEVEMARTGYTEERVRDDLRNELISERLYKVVTKDVPPATDATARRYFTKHPGEFRIGRSRAIAHILVKSKGSAASLYASLHGKPLSAFKKAAKKYSKDPGTAAKGGVMNIYAGQTIPVFEKAAFATARGAVSKPIRSQFGWHLIFAIGNAKPSRMPSFAEVRVKVRKQLDDMAQSSRFEAWQHDYRTASKPHVNCVPAHPWIA